MVPHGKVAGRIATSQQLARCSDPTTTHTRSQTDAGSPTGFGAAPSSLRSCRRVVCSVLPPGSTLMPRPEQGLPGSEEQGVAAGTPSAHGPRPAPRGCCWPCTPQWSVLLEAVSPRQEGALGWRLHVCRSLCRPQEQSFYEVSLASGSPLLDYPS